MPDRVTTSFIPKESLVTERGPKSPKRNPLAFVTLIAGIILVVAVAACAGLFLLKAYTTSSIASKKDSLDRQRAAFEPATIQELLRLDRRLQSAGELLKVHIAPSLLFAELESRTGANVRFRNFVYESATAGKKTVVMSGSAKSFNAVALQADAFGKSTIFKDPLFSNLNIDAAGNVVFEFSSVVDIARIRYAASASAALDGAAQGETVPPAPETTTATTTTP